MLFVSFHYSVLLQEFIAPLKLNVRILDNFSDSASGFPASHRKFCEN